MKSLFFIVIFFLSSRLFSFSPIQQRSQTTLNNSFDSIEVFVSITTHNAGVFYDVKSVLINLTGVNYIAYCPNHAVFMVYIDRNIYTTNNDFKNQLIKLLPQHSELIDLKNGVFKDFAIYCSTTDEVEISTLKNKFGQ